MRPPRMAILTLTLLVLTLAPTTAQEASPVAGGVRVAEVRPITIEDTRLISLSPDGRLLAATDFAMDHLCTYDATTLAEVACADQRDVVGLPEPQDVPHSFDEVVGLVADPASARKAYGVQIPAYLHRVYTGEVAELLAGDRVTAFLDELLRGPKILRQPVCQAGL